MAFFTSPCENHHEKAVISALECLSFLDRSSEQWLERGLPAIQVRIGIHSGDVLMGNFGSKRRFNYTILGDNVNLAARLEGLNKMYGSSILTTESTASKLNDIFAIRRVDNVRVVGKQEPTSVFNVLAYDEDLTEKDRANSQLYDRAFDLYLEGKFERAEEIFRSMSSYEQDMVAQAKVEQCREYQVNRRGTWDGIISMTSK
jgi:adenylate cyclase